MSSAVSQALLGGPAQTISHRATYYPRPDVVWTPITDIPPSEVRLAWVSTRPAPLIAEFVELAQAAVRDT